MNAYVAHRVPVGRAFSNFIAIFFLQPMFARSENNRVVLADDFDVATSTLN